MQQQEEIFHMQIYPEIRKLVLIWILPYFGACAYVIQS